MIEAIGTTAIIAFFMLLIFALAKWYNGDFDK